MTMLFMDGFDHYGPGDTGIENMLDGPWADLGLSVAADSGPAAPPWGVARTGAYAVSSNPEGIRRVLPASETALLIGQGYAVDSLPSNNDKTEIVRWNNGGNEVIARLVLQSTGVIELKGTSISGSVLATSTVPVVVSQNWHYLECKLDTVANTFRLDVDGTTVINATGLTIPAPPLPDTSKTIAQLVFNVSVSGGSAVQWMDDLTVRNTAGSYNNGFDGDLRVAALFANANGPNQGWTPQYRHKLGNGILDISSPVTALVNKCVSSPSSTSTNLPAGDFTVEGFFRFNLLPTGGNKAHLMGKWDEANNRRSWQLYLGGPTLENGNVVFRTSTDGAAGTVVETISFPWPGITPQLFQWYHIAIVRSSGQLLLFIDGNQYGLPQADVSTYFVGTAPLGIGGQVEGTSSVIAGTCMNGWMDELRITVGVARYTANFTPTTVPFGRNSGTDPDFSSVVLLCGFDSGLADESSYARTLTARNSAAAVTPDDGAAAYQAIYHHTPQDDTFVAASFIAATQTLTLAANPANGNSVTVGTYTDGGSNPAVYTFKTVLADPFDILIGATEADTLNNLQAAINLSAGAGTLYGTATIVNDDVTASGLPSPQMLVTANVSGTGGNAIASTSSGLSGGGGWGAATLQGGEDIPGNSDFYFDRPPPNTTLIAALQVVNRSYKSDAGAANIQASFLGPLGAAAVGADNPMTVSPTYHSDMVEEDPDTTGPITPTTIVGGRVRLNRTV